MEIPSGNRKTVQFLMTAPFFMNSFLISAEKISRYTADNIYPSDQAAPDGYHVQ